MSKPIIDRAEVAIDFPDKFYHGSFGRGSRFDVKPENGGVVVTLDRKDGEKRHVEFHIHYPMLEDLLEALAEAVGTVKDLPPQDRRRLKMAAQKLVGELS